MAHEDFEVAIERRLQGALDATEAETLRQHLEGCASCRDYEAAARELNSRMESMFLQTNATATLDRIGSKVQELMRQQRRSVWLVPLVLALFNLLPFAFSLTGNPSRLGLRLGVQLVIAVGMYALLRFFMGGELRRREAELAAKGGLAFYRDTLDRQLRVARVVRWLPLLLPLFVAHAYSARTAEAYTQVGLMLLLLPLAIWRQWRLTQRALRERAELR